MKLENYSTREILAELEARDGMSLEPEPEPVEEVELPKKINFAFYLHNDFFLNEIQETIEMQTGFAINDELARKVSNYFYEVRFDCELNTETGEMYSE